MHRTLACALTDNSAVVGRDAWPVVLDVEPVRTEPPHRTPIVGGVLTSSSEPTGDNSVCPASGGREVVEPQGNPRRTAASREPSRAQRLRYPASQRNKSVNTEKNTRIITSLGTPSEGRTPNGTNTALAMNSETHRDSTYLAKARPVGTFPRRLDRQNNCCVTGVSATPANTPEVRCQVESTLLDCVRHGRSQGKHPLIPLGNQPRVCPGMRLPLRSTRKRIRTPLDAC